MFKSFFDHIYLFFWSGEKKTGPHKEVLLSKKCEIFGGVVYDLRWSLKYIHKNGETSHKVTITERANKWDFKTILRRTEKEVLPRKIKELIDAHKDANSVK